MDQFVAELNPMHVSTYMLGCVHVASVLGGRQLSRGVDALPFPTFAAHDICLAPDWHTVL